MSELKLQLIEVVEDLTKAKMRTADGYALASSAKVAA
jgi:hypothetical protein